ncbi:MAG TPA: serine hydrolase [Gemmatimonadales bacterium]|jgi:CubicO group peptidase (beta-lactamase class C family)
MTWFRLLRSLPFLTLAAGPLSAQGRSASPSYEQIGAPVQAGLDALARGDTAAYLAGTTKAFAMAPQVPPVAYHHARAHALAGSPDSALALLARLATEGAVVVHEAPADSAFDRLRRSPRWQGVAARIEASRRPISTSTTAFELPERDLLAEGTAWDAKTRTLYLSSLYKRKIVAISPDGAAHDFIESGDEGIGPVAGLEVDPVRRGLWAASMVLAEAGIPLGDTTLLAHGLLFHYDVDTGRLRRRYVLPPAKGQRHGFNDLTVMPNGDVYITDSPSGGVYALEAGRDEFVEVLPPGTYTFPNGITRSDDGRLLFVAHGSGVDRLEVGTGRRVRLRAPDTLNLGGIDGLAFHRNTLIAHQPSSFNRVLRLGLDSRQERIASWEILERHHPRFKQPTTGEVAGELYYYIANAQLRSFHDGKILPWDSLSPVLVLKTDLSDASSKAREAVREAIGSGAAPGVAVAVGRAGSILWTDGFGVRDLAARKPVDPRTKFGIGSISKTLTLAAALALADAGRLDLDAPVERYLPDFPHPGQGVTVRRIGAHQSGIADDFANDHYWSRVHFELDSAYRLIAAAPMTFPPGTRTEYATGLFTIVGKVLERVGGQSYLGVMQQIVLEPTRMAATVPNDPRRPPAERTVFYVTGGRGFEPAPAFDPSFKLPGAGFLSTAEDLVRFGMALLEPGLLSAQARRHMFTPVALADGTPTRYALGFQALEDNGRRLLLQSGGGPGISSWLAIYPEEKLVVALLSNAMGAPLDATVRQVGRFFLTPPAPAPPPQRRRASAQVPSPPPAR